jgi:hypothetical protein
MTNATVPSVQAAHAFEPTSVEGGFALAQILVASRLLPRSVNTPEAAFTIIMCGRELGLTAMQSLRAIHVIDGKPTMSADLMLALVKRNDVCVFFRLVQSSADLATYETHRKGEPEPTKMSFTIDEARVAGLTGKDPWKRYPAAMLRARCIAALARAVYPDVMLGVYESDELSPAGDSPIVARVEVQQAAPGRDDLARAIADAQTSAELRAVGQQIARAKAALQPGDIEDLKARYEARRASLAVEASPTPQPAGEEAAQ